MSEEWRETQFKGYWVSSLGRIMMYGYFYRWLMKFAHRYNWHHATVCYPEGDTLFWCQWCGMRDVMKRGNYSPIGQESQLDKKARGGE